MRSTSPKTASGPKKDAYRPACGASRGRSGAWMVGEDAYCIDVLTQNAAASKALRSVALGLLEEHMRHCLVDAVAAGEGEADAKIIEAKAAIERLVKS